MGRRGTPMALAARDVAALRSAMEGGEDPAFLMFWRPDLPNAAPSPASCSQWAPISIADPTTGVVYATAEHYMMAEKARLFHDEHALAAILADQCPRKARTLGRKVQNYEDEAWAAARFEAVVRGNVLKFGQHEQLRAWLLSTAGHVLVEASPSDCVWGIGLTESHQDAAVPARWRGTNLLGFALMEARARLAAESEKSDAAVGNKDQEVAH